MKKRLIILNSIVMFIALVIVLLISSISIVNIGQKNTKEKLNNYLTLITNIVQSDGPLSAYNMISDSNFEIRLTIIDLNGNVLYDTQMKELENHLDRDEIKNPGVVYERFSKSVGHKMAYLAAKTDSYYIRVALPTSKVDSFVSNYILISTIVVIIIFLLSTIVIVKNNDLTFKKINQNLNELSNIAGSDTISNVDVDDMVSVLTLLSKKFENIITDSKYKEECLHTLINSVSQGIVVINKKGQINIINNQAPKLLRIQLTDYKNKNFRYLSNNIELQNKIDVCLNAKKNDFIEVNENGTYLNIRFSYIDTEWISGVIMTIDDVTSLMNLENNKKEFFQNASHELKSPLTCIIGYQQMITEGILDTKEQILDSANKSLKETIRMNDILSDMLSLATIEARQTSLKENINPKAIIEDVVITLSIEAKKNNIKISTDLDDNTLFASRTEFNEVVRNLIDNAIKYNKENGTIFVSYKDGILIVKDTGIGIKDEDKSRIFERFYRVDKARSKKTGGTGLGLAIVKHICLNNNYKLDLGSRLGLGTTFKIYFK